MSISHLTIWAIVESFDKIGDCKAERDWVLIRTRLVYEYDVVRMRVGYCEGDRFVDNTDNVCGNNSSDYAP